MSLGIFPRNRVVADPTRAAWLRTGTFVSLDPGLNYPAAAIFERGVLEWSSRVSVPGAFSQLDPGERCRRVARLAAEVVLEKLAGRTPIATAIEFPQIYARDKSEGDPNDLPPLAAIGVGFAAYLDAQTIAILPKEWTGGTPKAKKGDAWKSPRGMILRSRLKPAEVAAIVTSHDALDSVGVGLKVLCRLERNLPGTI